MPIIIVSVVLKIDGRGVATASCQTLPLTLAQYTGTVHTWAPGSMDRQLGVNGGSFSVASVSSAQ